MECRMHHSFLLFRRHSPSSQFQKISRRQWMSLQLYCIVRSFSVSRRGLAQATIDFQMGIWTMACVCVYEKSAVHKAIEETIKHMNMSSDCAPMNWIIRRERIECIPMGDFLSLQHNYELFRIDFAKEFASSVTDNQNIVHCADAESKNRNRNKQMMNVWSDRFQFHSDVNTGER